MRWTSRCVRVCRLVGRISSIRATRQRAEAHRCPAGPGQRPDRLCSRVNRIAVPPENDLQGRCPIPAKLGGQASARRETCDKVIAAPALRPSRRPKRALAIADFRPPNPTCRTRSDAPYRVTALPLAGRPSNGRGGSRVTERQVRCVFQASQRLRCFPTVALLQSSARR